MKTCTEKLDCQCAGCRGFWLRVKLAVKNIDTTTFNLLVDAYKSAHVCADITEKVFEKKNLSVQDVEWLREEALNLLATAVKIATACSKVSAGKSSQTAVTDRRYKTPTLNHPSRRSEAKAGQPSIKR